MQSKETGQVQFPFAQGHQGSHIGALNRKLASLGYFKQSLTDPSTMTFTEATKNALNAFVRDINKTPDDKCDLDTWAALNHEAGSVFPEVLQYELDGLAEPSKKPSVKPVDEKEVIAAAHRAHLAGLAFSGGGIRSATFSLGILQALAELGLLSKFDYVSSVSGGGFISGWLSKWVMREKGGIDQVEQTLGAHAEEKMPPRKQPEEVRYLRKYSNYLSPKTGAFSTDTWALIATYIRNLALNLTILTAFMALVLILPRLLVFAAVFVSGLQNGPLGCLVVAAVGFNFTLYQIARGINTEPGLKTSSRLSQAAVLWRAVLPLMLSALVGSVAMWEFRPEFGEMWKGLLKDTIFLSWKLTYLLAPGLGYCLVNYWAKPKPVATAANPLDPAATMRAKLKLRNRFGETVNMAGQRLRDLEWPHVRALFGNLLCAVVGFGVAALLLAWVLTLFTEPKINTEVPQQIRIVTFGPASILAAFGIAITLVIGLAGRMYSEKCREWWSRQGGWTTICTLGWLCISVISLYGAPVMDYVFTHLQTWEKILLGGGWLGSVVGGILLGHSSATGNESERSNLQRIINRLVPLVPPLFCVGAMLIVSTLTFLLLLPDGHSYDWGKNQSWLATVGSYYKSVEAITLAHTLGVTAVLLTVVLVLSWRVDINKFSLHMMYRNRLVRAYLGATNRNRNPHPFTGFDEKDDIFLDELAPGGKLQRPLHIINTALNLTSGKELGWQTRKAASFSFSPSFCGFELPAGTAHDLAQEALRGCYRPTEKYRRPVQLGDKEEIGVKLGMAMAVSGAAVSPNMGYHSSPSLAFLMTLFNVRLGRWFANPLQSTRRAATRGHEKWHKHRERIAKRLRYPLRADWRTTSPRFGMMHLFSELFGWSDSKHGYFHLSDGGHFENLGVYELVRRRCRLIVAIDATADGDFQFADLGNAVRKCATDLNIDIDVDIRQVERIQPSKFSKAYCVAGKIRYTDTDSGKPGDSKGEELDGTFFYIKPCLVGNEPAGIKHYMNANKDFPHQSTVDQWFDETQFESYRSLGHLVGKRAFRSAAEALQAEAPGDTPGDPGSGSTPIFNDGTLKKPAAEAERAEQMEMALSEAGATGEHGTKENPNPQPGGHHKNDQPDLPLPSGQPARKPASVIMAKAIEKSWRPKKK